MCNCGYKIGEIAYCCAYQKKTKIEEKKVPAAACVCMSARITDSAMQPRMYFAVSHTRAGRSSSKRKMAHTGTRFVIAAAKDSGPK